MALGMDGVAAAAMVSVIRFPPFADLSKWTANFPLTGNYVNEL
jgi:hypothetical protein